MLNPKTNRLLVAAALLAMAAPAWACGPYLGTHLLSQPNESVLWAPTGELAEEIGRIRLSAPPTAAYVESPGPYYHTEQVAMNDLSAALMARGTSWPEMAKAVASWTAARRQIRDFQTGPLEDWRRDRERRWGKTDVPRPALVAEPVAPGLPAEFDLYLKGSLAYHGGRHDEARKVWSDLLALPAGERAYRSTWAAFMIGRSYARTDPAEAAPWFEKTRQLAADGFRDPLGLAAASFGRQAQAELRQSHYAAAIGLYLKQHATGDPTALWSLRVSALRVLSETDKEALILVAGDFLARRVVTAVLVARGGPYMGYHRSISTEKASAWLEAVEAAGVTDLVGADRLAWAAYQAGQMDLASRWVDRADAELPMTLWVRAKLLLRSGRTDEAIETLDRAVAALLSSCELCTESKHRSFRPTRSRACPPANAAGELAVLKLATGDYERALDLFLRHRWRLDAAYVAERVLTVDELKQYVDANWPEALATQDLPPLEWAWRPKEMALTARSLLSRRLARAGRWEEAKAYFFEYHRGQVDDYLAALQAGDDASLPADQRAEHLWQAAKIMRWRGMDLVGTYGAPDWRCYGGSFERYSVAVSRQYVPDDSDATTSSADERRRLREHAVEPDKRYHYRYLAADIAWRAAELMPDQADRTASILCQAGTWVKILDPEFADRFYKALVIRCGQTELGRQADQRRWFPEIELEEE